MIRVVIAADLARTRADLRLALASDGGIAVVGDVAVAADLVPTLARLRPSVVVLQFRPGALAEPSVRQLLRRLCMTRTKIVVRALVADVNHLISTLRLGISGFALIDGASDDLPTVIRAAVGNKHLPNAGVTLRLLAQDRRTRPEPYRPSPIERRVLACIGAGMTNVEIAADLGLHPKTTYAYTNHLMAKLNVPNRMQLAVCAHDLGLIPAA